jgi:serine/threonine-protein kinase
MLAGRYALEEELGRSGTGVVWRARDTVLDRTVTVKLLRPILAEDPAFVARLAADASAVARIGAPGLTRLLDSGADRGVSFLVREHVEGESLRERLEREGPLDVDEAVRVALAVLDALGEAHAAGALHLDVKPENVLLAPDGRIALADLGLGEAVRAARPADAADLLAPTPDIPELARAAGVPDVRSDVFLAGALLAESLTGRLPDRPGEAPQAPKTVAAVVRRAIAADPADRYPDVRAFADALHRATAEPASAREAHGLRGWLLVPGLVLGATVAAIALGLWLGRLELGGPLGVRAAVEEPSPPPSTVPASVVLPLAGISAFDPFGDGTENDAGAPAAIDADLASAWRSENYFDGDLRKPGMGLLLDLGETRTVTGFRLSTPHPGWAFGVAVGEDPDALATAADPAFTAGASMRGRLEPATGRYVLLWIVSVVDVGDGNRAEVAEIRVIGPDA